MEFTQELSPPVSGPTRSGTRPTCGSATAASSNRPSCSNSTSRPANARCSSGSRCSRTSPPITSSPASGRPPRTAPGSRCPSCGARRPTRTGRRRCCSTATAPTRRARTRTSRWPACPCSTAAWCSSSPTSGAAARWGWYWYEDGKELNKKNTFTDFVAAGRYLVETGWTTPRQMVAEGGSAAACHGVVANLAPELFNGILAAVPFVDALNSILDPSLPLTVIEWDEWGDPLHDPKSLRVHEDLHAVRERGGEAVPADPGAHLAELHPRALRRGGEMGCPASGRSRPRAIRSC